MDASPEPEDLAELSFIDYTHGRAFSEVSWQVVAADPFLRWYATLKDWKVRRLVSARIQRLADGQLGDSRGWGGGLWELRIHFGPGLRVYFAYQEGRVVLLLGGGLKRGQDADVARARTTLKRLSPRTT